MLKVFKNWQVLVDHLSYLVTTHNPTSGQDRTIPDAEELLDFLNNKNFLSIVAFNLDVQGI